VVKTFSGSTPLRSLVPKPSTVSTPLPSPVKKGTHVASGFGQVSTDQTAHEKKKEATDKEVPANLNDLKKKFWVSTGLDPK
jgi:hypothetical protein